MKKEEKLSMIKNFKIHKNQMEMLNKLLLE